MNKRRPMNWWLEFAIHTMVIFAVVLGMVFVGLSPMGKGHAVLAKRTNCQSNFSCIYKGIALYRGEYQDVASANLFLLVDRKTVSAKAFICHASQSLCYAHCPEADSEDVDEGYVLTHSSYVYVPIEESFASGLMCMMYELPINHRQEGSNLCAVNASVAWDDNDKFLARVQNLNDYLCRERDLRK